MSDVWDITRKHFEAAVAEAHSAKIPDDVIGRAFLALVLEHYKKSRKDDDIAAELRFQADNLNQDEDQAFMRP